MRKAKRAGRNILVTLAILLAATTASLAASFFGISKESIVMVFLLGVLFTTVLTGGYVFGTIESVLSLIILNFLFTEPRFTFVISSSSDIILLLFFLVTAVVSGVVTSRLAQQMELAARNLQTARVLYQIASGFLPVSGRQNIIERGVAYVRTFTGYESAVRMPDQALIGASAKEPAAASPADSAGSSAELANSHLLAYKLQGTAGSLGQLLVDAKSGDLDDQAELIIQTVATQLGIALDRENLHSEQEAIRISMEREHLRATLLRSVAHDLRSPLTALSGAGNLLADEYDSLSDEQRKKLAADISEEIVWLTNLVENILQMTRINEAQLILEKEEEVLDDVVSEALTHIKRLFKSHTFAVRLPDEVFTVPMDGRLIVKVLVNLLENAVRHTPAGSEIHLEVRTKPEQVEIAVSDNGSGIDARVAKNLFDPFITANQGVTDGKRGMGLGLAICKAIVEAHGGIIRAEANQPRGARFVFSLPRNKQGQR